MPAETDRRDVIQHQRDERRKDRYRTLEEHIEELLKECARRLEDGSKEDYHDVAEILCRDGSEGNQAPGLIQAVEEYSPRSFSAYARRLSSHDDFDWVALSSFLDAPRSYVNRLNGAGGSPGLRSLAMQTNGLASEDMAARVTVEKTVASLAAIAEDERVVMADYAQRVDALGFAQKLGENLQDGEMDLGDPVHAVSWQTEGLKSLHCGGTGMSKSAGLETECEDFYLYDSDKNHTGLEHRPPGQFKLMDLADLENGESWFYDVPQQQELLREIREEQGLPSDFTDADEPFERSMKIYAPLTPNLDDLELPYDTEAEEWTVEPFVIPASDMPKDLLMTAIGNRVSSREMRTIRQAYDDVDREREDWALQHLADEIRSRKELSDKHKAGAIGVLRSLQDEGFIRTAQDGPTLDWGAIFRDTETVTAFTQSAEIVDTEAGQFIVIAYLLHKLLELRSGSTYLGLDEGTLAIRELWKIVPHSQREVASERAAAVQAIIGDLMGRLLRENRKYKLNVVADTQKPFDLKNSVREMFNRYVVYSGTNKFVEGAFSWTQNERHQSFRKTITSKRGQASIVGEVQPAIEKSWVEYLPPVEYAPPAHHHWDKNVDDSGWQARAEYLDREELRRPDWETAIPDHLLIEPYTAHQEINEGENTQEDHPDPKTLHRAEARNRNARGESLREIRSNIPNNPETGDPYGTTTIGEWTEDIEKGSANDGGSDT